MATGGICVGRRRFPFRLGRQARPGPAGVGVRLIIADVADGLGGIDGTQSVEAKAHPAFFGAAPVERRFDAVLGRPLPAVRKPVRGRSEEHTSELQSLMRISYAVFCLKKKT